MIDEGEALLAVIGIKRVVALDVGRVTADEWKQARAMDARIQRMASELVRGVGNGEVPDIDPLSYDKTLDRLTEAPSPEQIAGLVANFPPAEHDAESAFLAVAGRAYNYLRASFPISVERHLVGADNLPPSEMAIAAFEFVLQIVDRPLDVFALLDAGALLSSQAKALAACYPTLRAAVLQAIDARVRKEVAEHPAYEPPFQMGISTLAGGPYIDPKVGAALAGSKAQIEAQKQQARAQQPEVNRSTSMTAPPSRTPETSQET